MALWSIRTRLLVYFCLLTVGPVAILGTLLFFQTVDMLEQRVSREMRIETVAAAETVETYLHGVQRDLLSLQRFLQRRLPLGSEENLWQEMGEEFFRVLQAEGSYYQIRFIGADGWEKLRINNLGGQLVSVPSKEHQYKGDRYYVTETLRLPPGKIYLSPLDFNVEHGRIEEPRRLVTRMATPVPDRQGAVAGIVIINIFGEDLLKMLEAVPPVGGSQLFLVGEKDYVERFRGEKGIDIQVGDVETLAGRLGVPLTDLRQNRKARVTPLETTLLATAPITAEGYAWLLVKTYPRRLLKEDLHRIQATIVILALALLLPATALAVVAAHSFSRPIDKVIRFADAIAGGDYEQPLHLRRRDEFSHLAAALNEMAAALATSRRRLTDWNRSLQAEVDRRTQELQSALGRLEAGKEELEFLNEELTAINAEMQCRMDELEQTNLDLWKLLDSSESATLFVDRELRIVRFTPAAAHIFNLLPTDTGRSLKHFTGNLDYPDLERDAHSVLQGKTVEPREVADFSGRTHYRVQLSPDRNATGDSVGVVFTFRDIRARVRLEKELRQAHEAVRRSPAGGPGS